MTEQQAAILKPETMVEEFKKIIHELQAAWVIKITAQELESASRMREELRLAFLESSAGTCGEERLRLAMKAHTVPPAEWMEPKKAKAVPENGTVA